jgi:hypothetical protein
MEKEAEYFYRCDLRAEWLRPLEFDNSPALQTRLAGPIGFATAFCNEATGFSYRRAIGGPTTSDRT